MHFADEKAYISIPPTKTRVSGCKVRLKSTPSAYNPFFIDLEYQELTVMSVIMEMNL